MLDESIFADYAAAQGDFGPAATPEPATPYPAIPIPQSPVAGIQFQGPTGGQLAGQAQQAVSNPLEEVGNHPLFQFYNQWKRSSPEVRKSAEEKLRKDFPNPRAMGLFDPTADVDAEALALREGKSLKEDKGAWGKFMKYIDSNPKFLLDLGARLLAPRRNGQTDLGFAVKGLNEAVQAQTARQAAIKRAAIQDRKTGAEIGQIEADTSKTPSDIQLTYSKIYKNYQDANAGNKPAAAVQLLDNLAEAYWKTGGDKLYATPEEAKIAAARQLHGAGPEEEAFYKIYGQSMESLGTTPDQIKTVIEQAKQSGDPVWGARDFDAQKTVAAKQKTEAQQFVDYYKGDKNAMVQALQTQHNLSPEKAEQTVDNLLGAAGKVRAVKSKPRQNLRDTLAARSKKSTEKSTSKSKTTAAKLRSWEAMTKPGGSGMIDMTPAKAKTVVAEIEKDFENYSKAEQERAADLVELLESKFK